MIAWGGFGNNTYYNTGGVYYNPLVTGLQNIITETPSAFSLSQNYPNPFNPVTKISFVIPKRAMVTLNVYDISGSLAAILINGETRSEGKYYINFNGEGLSSGIYFYRLSSGEYTETRKMILLK